MDKRCRHMQQAMQHAMSMSTDKRQRNAACKMQLRIANLSDAVWHAETSEYAMRNVCAPVDENNFAKHSDSLARGFPVNTTGWCLNVVRRLLQRSQRTEMHMDKRCRLPVIGPPDIVRKTDSMAYQHSWRVRA